MLKDLPLVLREQSVLIIEDSLLYKTFILPTRKPEIISGSPLPSSVNVKITYGN